MLYFNIMNIYKSIMRIIRSLAIISLIIGTTIFGYALLQNTKPNIGLIALGNGVIGAFGFNLSIVSILIIVILTILLRRS